MKLNKVAPKPRHSLQDMHDMQHIKVGDSIIRIKRSVLEEYLDGGNK